MTLLGFGRWPLRLKIVLLLFASSVLPLAAVGIVEFNSARDEVLRNAAALLTARGDEIEGKLDAFHQRYRQGAERIAELPDIVAYAAAPAPARDKQAPAARGLLEQWQKADGSIRGMAILDAAGTVLLATEPKLAGSSLAGFGYVREVLKGGTVISDLHNLPPEVGAGETAIAYLAPLRERRGGGAVAVWVRADAFWALVAEGNEKAGAKSFAVLFDHHGVRIAHSYNRDIVFHPGGRLDPAVLNAMVAERRFGERTRQLLEEPRVFPEQFDRARASSPSREVFRGFAPVNQQWNVGVARRLTSVPWTLFYMIPEKSLDALVEDLVLRIGLLVASVMALAIAAGFLVSRGIVGSIRLVTEVSESLSAAAAQLTASVSQIAASTAETATAVSETSTTVAEVKQTAQVSTDKARQVSEGAQKTAQISQNGRKAIEESVEGMRRIQEQMVSIAESIVRLAEQNQTIGEIIATVNDLAEQSNLLAVNAAIEAAKAGEHGKGFAVVAQEVKSLAEQSKQATAQVRTILGDIQKATSAAVMATEQGNKAVDAGMTLSTEVGESIRVLSDSIVAAAQAAVQIAVSAQQQLAGMDQVALAMQSIQQASEQNAESTKQNESAARGLHELRAKLKQLTETYRI
ncbi:methyl-accepting chemotaxis protein [Sulfuritalea sp.]|uniref:methyl-accepting chemotaxis protein n=1 Tax=Sulfuritalea sp. TaxID=2480090 RepID=UPI00286E1ACC|nr:methyl-accepting chemotaxis protein [Sulfuritalea sp.]